MKYCRKCARRLSWNNKSGYCWRCGIKQKYIEGKNETK